MAIRSGFFSSVNGDRLYTADDVNKIYNCSFSDGVFKNVEHGLAVTAYSGVAVQVAPGRAISGGNWIENDEYYRFSLPTPDSTYPRYDAIVARCDKTTRNVTIAAISGAPATSPQKPAPNRTSTINDIILAYVYVPANATQLTSDNITDARSNSDVCGWVSVNVTVKTGTFRRNFTSDGTSQTYIVAYPSGSSYSNDDVFNVFISGILQPASVPQIAGRLDGGATVTLPVLESGTVINVVVYKNGF